MRYAVWPMATVKWRSRRLLLKQYAHASTALLARLAQHNFKLKISLKFRSLFNFHSSFYPVLTTLHHERLTVL